MRVCEECGEEIIGGNVTAVVCRGTWVDGKRIYSKCDKERRRRNKNKMVAHYSGGGKYCAYELRDWIKNTCLKCGEVFNAKSKTNRICYSCGLENDLLISKEKKLWLERR